MSKTLTEAQVTTANARSRLGLGVHWRRLDAEAHLGYRKGKQGGVWFVRWRNHDNPALASFLKLLSERYPLPCAG